MKTERIRREKNIKKSKKKNTLEKQSQAMEIKKSVSMAKLSMVYHDREKINRLAGRLKKEKRKEKSKISKIKKDFLNMCRLEEEWVNKLKSSKKI